MSRTKRPTKSRGHELNDALSSLAIQGIAFTSETGKAGEKEYMVDRVQLKGDELVYLHSQHALTANGIRAYLLTRSAAKSLEQKKLQ